MTRNLHVVVAVSVVLVCCGPARADAPPEFVKHVMPVFTKYCVGCHNAVDREGKLSLETFGQLQQGGKRGPAVVPGDAQASRLIRTLTGQAKPVMPPEGNDVPTKAEVTLLVAWVNAGAKGPNGAEPDRRTLVAPQLPAAAGPRAITALAWSPDGKQLAAARFDRVQVLNVSPSGTTQPARELAPHPGKVTALEFASSGATLVAASGATGLGGEATLWDVAGSTAPRRIAGHLDTLYAATLDPAGSLLATAGYDRSIVLWDAATGTRKRSFDGHTGAVFDLAFSPDGRVLASASADDTVKLWHVASGMRLDTLGQGLDDQFAVAFAPRGQEIVAAGADNRIRVWQFVSREKPQINPLLHARYAHEGPIVQLAFARDGGLLVSASEDRTVKLWETAGYTQIAAFDRQSDIPAAIALSPDARSLAVGRLDGSLQVYNVPARPARPSTGVGESPNVAAVTVARDPSTSDPAAKTAEQEPNDAPGQATPLAIPAVAKGTIHAASGARDVDLFRIAARAGEAWVLEVNAARSKSPLDSKIEVLDERGERVPRVLLHAVRDSYFTFRGKDSDTSNDFRVFNWEEMELNELLYANGEVVKLWHYPRGPDSGFLVYPGFGKRYGLFDTTPLAHPLGGACYVVEPHAPGTPLVPNGLPAFTLYYENDDDSQRRLGSDSRLTFTAPRTGDYLVRVSDVRGFHGPQFAYDLHVRPRRPDFRATLAGAAATIPAGSGKEFEVRVERLDGYEGEVRIDVTGLPPGFAVTNPLVIEAGQDNAFGTLTAAADAPAPTAENAKTSKITATASIDGQNVTHEVGSFGELKLGPKPKVLVMVLSADPLAGVSAGPLELTIAPGQTITARVRVERNGFDGRIQLGSHDAGRNLPHGVYVDNIGLNGLLIPEGQHERTFFITAAKIVRGQSRLFHIRADSDGTQTSVPVLLRVKGGP